MPTRPRRACCFGTNVAAIIATGTIVLLFYRVRDAAMTARYPVGRMSVRTLAVVGLAIVIVAIPLAIGTANVASDRQLRGGQHPHRPSSGEGQRDGTSPR